jgi:hypothetical protein
MPWDDLEDFTPADGDNDDDPDDWSEEQWEALLRESDERSRKMMELLDKYGHDQQGFRKAMATARYLKSSIAAPPSGRASRRPKRKTKKSRYVIFRMNYLPTAS